MKTANIQEIFYSIQGEGRLVGVPMVFVRFTGCNLRCWYCDTKKALQPSKNNMPVSQLVKLIKKYQVEFISFTGGEPILQAEYIREVIKKLGKKYKYLLETNGTLPEKLEILKDLIDIYSIDIKKGYEADNIKFCRKLKNKDKYLKIVLEKNLNVNKLLKTIKSCGLTEVYLQPLAEQKLNMSLIQSIINKSNLNIRVIPQIHKLLDIK